MTGVEWVLFLCLKSQHRCVQQPRTYPTEDACKTDGKTIVPEHYSVWAYADCREKTQ
jgi:hypothetical protein